MSNLREGDIEALRSKMRDQGRPIKSKIIMDGDTQVFYAVNEKGRVKITEKLDLVKKR